MPTLYPGVLVPRSNRNDRTARYGPLLIPAALPSIPRGPGSRWTWKLVAFSGPSNDFEVTYGGTKFRLFFRPQRAREHRQSRGPQRVRPAMARVPHRFRFLHSCTARVAPTEMLILYPVLPQPATKHDQSGSTSLAPAEDGGIFSHASLRVSHSLFTDSRCRLGWAGAPTQKRCLGLAAYHLLGFSRLSRTRAMYED